MQLILNYLKVTNQYHYGYYFVNLLDYYIKQGILNQRYNSYFMFMCHTCSPHPAINGQAAISELATE
jgi:hypothetical protein